MVGRTEIVMKKLTADEFRKVELGIADEIHRICQEHGMRYSLAYGTLLGAIRHKGFIPWDDDMDVFMLREDYDEFIDHFDEWRHDERFAMMAPRKMNSSYCMAKVIDQRTYVKSIWDKERYSLGVWVDVIPVEHFDETKRDELVKQVMRKKLLRQLAVSDPKAGDDLRRIIAKHLVCPIASAFLEPMAIAREIDGMAWQHAPEPTGTLCPIVNMHGKVNPFPAEWFDNMVAMPFEDREYLCPANYEEVLTYEFGDWRTPIEGIPHLEDAYWLDGADTSC
jgi:lipopolysaccharide cholinephosphotransferase